jgi:hypothetical protein
MRIDEIQALWEADANIDRMELGNEAIKIPKLHSKYYKIYIDERLALRKAQADYKVLLKDKQVYYMGGMDKAELDERGWEQNPIRVLKADLPTYIDADPDIIKQALKIGYQQEKVDFLESVIKTLRERGFNIKSAIEWARFQVGG